MHPLLVEIFEKRTYRNSQGNVIAINSETPREQCQYLQDLIRDNGLTSSLEIGFAYGLSTLAIVESIAAQGGRHIVMDKFQSEDWGNNGLDLINQTGYGEKLDFYGRFCYEVLPELLRQNVRIDFAYIDSTKQMDWLMVDFFYIDKLMKVGGIVVFDDVSFPGIRRLLRYLSHYPGYTIHSQFPANAPISKIRSMARWLKWIPKANKLFRSDILVPDHQLGLNSNCVALIKTAEDTRGWDWDVDF